jgi:hypothetical protein
MSTSRKIKLKTLDNNITEITVTPDVRNIVNIDICSRTKKESSRNTFNPCRRPKDDIQRKTT